MTPAHIDSLSDAVDKISLRDQRGNINSKPQDASPTSSSYVKPTGSQEVSETVTKTPPTLLTIPQELRDDIFTHVYATAVDDDRTIGLHIVSFRRAGIESHEAPPTKATLLVCKQLHTEMRKMQAAAIRQYWTTHRFLANPERARPAGLHLDIVSNGDLQHACDLIFPYHRRKLKCTHISLHFGSVSGWTITLKAPELTRDPYFLHLSVQDILRPRLREMINILGKGRGGDSASAIDPSTGRGFTVDELDQFSTLVK